MPGWEGSVGPFRTDYGKPHVYARDVHSGAGNCVCGSHLGHAVHVQAAPGVPVPDSMRDPSWEAAVTADLSGRGNGKSLPKLFVLAATHTEARYAARGQDLRPIWTYVQEPLAVRGYRRPCVWAADDYWSARWSTEQVEEFRACLRELGATWVTAAELDPWRYSTVLSEPASTD